MSDQELMKFFKFDEADRLANQAGRITAKQKLRFREDDPFNKKRGLIGGILLLVIAALGLAIMVFAWIKYSGDLPMAIIFLSVGGIWMIIGGISAGFVLARYHASPGFIVAKVQGHARIVDVQSSYANNRVGVHQELQIGGKRFMATKVMEGILQGQQAIVYYFDRPSKSPSGITHPSAAEDILSVELLESTGPPAPPEDVPDHEAEQAEKHDPGPGEWSAKP
jgi:hypothetical protein